MKPGIETIGRLPLFIGLESDMLDRLNAIGDVARFGPNDEILPQNEVPQEIVLLLSGAIASTHNEPRQGSAVIDVLLPVSIVGCSAALLRKPAEHGARTIAPSRCILFPAAEFDHLLQGNAELSRRLFNTYLRETTHLQKELCALKLHSAAERLAIYLLELAEGRAEVPPRFVLPFEKRFLAGKIGCSQANLSRAFAALRVAGVETRRDGVVLRDPLALRAFATGSTGTEWAYL